MTLPALNQVVDQYAPIAEPTLIKLTYGDAVVLAVVEPAEGREPALAVQYTIHDESQANTEVWTALLHFDPDSGRWRLRVPTRDRPHKKAIAAVCLDVLRTTYGEATHHDVVESR